MTKIVIDLRDDTAKQPGLANAVLKGVMTGLWSILVPPKSTLPSYRKTWVKRVDNGRWVKVWMREY
jgi:hypothetical protein